MKVVILGVPDSAGAYCVGVERAPSRLRESGLVDALARTGVQVQDAGDLTTRKWQPDRENPRVQNLAEEVEATLELARAASSLLDEGSRLLVIGGSCMVAVGLCAALEQLDQPPRVIYIDRHFDLNTPESTMEGSLSWMGMAHALRLDHAAPGLVDALGEQALLAPTDLVYLGVDPAEATQWERDQVQRLGIHVVPQSELSDEPQHAAQRALGLSQPGPFFVHLDVDVLDFLDAPLAENPNGRNSGPTVEQLRVALRELVQQPRCWGLSIGQLDVAHAESDPDSLDRFIAALAAAFG